MDTNQVTELKFTKLYETVALSLNLAVSRDIKVLIEAQLIFKNNAGIFNTSQLHTINELLNLLNDHISNKIQNDSAYDRIKNKADEIINYACDMLKLNGCLVVGCAQNSIYVKSVNQEQLILANKSIIDIYGKSLCLINTAWI